MDLLTFEASWGRYGFGTVASLPSAVDETLGTRQFSLGPSALAIVNVTEKLQVGVLSQNLFYAAGPRDVATIGLAPLFLPPFFIPTTGATRVPTVSMSIVQPFFSYNLGKGWNVGSSELAYTYDWTADRWSSLPLGLRISKAVKSKGTPIVISFFTDYNFAKNAPNWQFRSQIAFLFP